MYDNAVIDRFVFEEREAIVVHPTAPSNGRWIWKAEYYDAFPNCEEAMVTKGYHICYLDHPTRWAPDSEVEVSAAFLRYVAETYKLETRGIAVGMSCGGLMSSRLAEAHPELIAVMYLDAPVMNILSLAGLGEAPYSEQFHRELVDTYGFNKCSLVTFRGSPIDNMKPLLEHRIPVMMIYGNADDVVIYAENGKVLEDYYRSNGGTIKVICKSMCNHHPHGLTDPQPIIDFVEAHFGEAI